MARDRRLGAATLAVAVAVGTLALTGCGSAPVDCVAMVVNFPSTANPGVTIDVELTNVLPGCNSKDNWFRADTVSLTLVSVDTREAELATGTADVGADGTATVPLTIPADATGRVSVEQDGFSFGTITLTD